MIELLERTHDGTMTTLTNGTKPPPIVKHGYWTARGLNALSDMITDAIEGRGADPQVTNQSRLEAATGNVVKQNTLKRYRGNKGSPVVTSPEPLSLVALEPFLLHPRLKRPCRNGELILIVRGLDPEDLHDSITEYLTEVAALKETSVESLVKSAGLTMQDIAELEANCDDLDEYYGDEDPIWDEREPGFNEAWLYKMIIQLGAVTENPRYIAELCGLELG